VGDEVPQLISYPYAMKKFLDGEAAVNFVIRRFFIETMYPHLFPLMYRKALLF
jgi:hypothetical protein